jgi:hypothetical protein
MSVTAIVHSIEAIEALLMRGMTPKTDNEAALVALGFARSSPAAQSGHDETLWERSVDHASRSSGGRRMLVRERAVLAKPQPGTN